MQPYDPRKKKKENKTYFCSYCDQSFTSLALLLEHEERHESESEGPEDQGHGRKIPYRG